jgi:hypothetical protein
MRTETTSTWKCGISPDPAYREVDGVQLPFRLRRAAGGETEDTIVDRYRINPKIDPRRRDVRK